MQSLDQTRCQRAITVGLSQIGKSLREHFEYWGGHIDNWHRKADSLQADVIAACLRDETYRRFQELQAVAHGLGVTKLEFHPLAAALSQMEVQRFLETSLAQQDEAGLREARHLIKHVSCSNRNSAAYGEQADEVIAVSSPPANAEGWYGPFEQSIVNWEVPPPYNEQLKSLEGASPQELSWRKTLILQEMLSNWLVRKRTFDPEVAYSMVQDAISWLRNRVKSPMEIPNPWGFVFMGKLRYLILDHDAKNKNASHYESMDILPQNAESTYADGNFDDSPDGDFERVRNLMNTLPHKEQEILVAWIVDGLKEPRRITQKLHALSGDMIDTRKVSEMRCSLEGQLIEQLQEEFV